MPSFATVFTTKNVSTKVAVVIELFSTLFASAVFRRYSFVLSIVFFRVVIPPFPAFWCFEPCSTVFRPFCSVRFVNVRYQRVTQEYLFAQESIELVAAMIARSSTVFTAFLTFSIESADSSDVEFFAAKLILTDERAEGIAFARRWILCSTVFAAFRSAVSFGKKE